MIVSWPIHVAVNGHVSSFVMSEWYSMRDVSINQLSVDGHWVCFHVLAIVEKYAVAVIFNNHLI